MSLLSRIALLDLLLLACVEGASAQPPLNKPPSQPLQPVAGDRSRLRPFAIDTSYCYQLSNAFLGPGRALDTYSDGENLPFMGVTGDYSGQLWKLAPLADGSYRLTNLFLGPGRALDTYSDDEHMPFMGRTDRDYSGQHWFLVPLGDGSYRLHNAFLGEGRALDTYSGQDNKPFMGRRDQDYSGQHWRLRRMKPCGATVR